MPFTFLSARWANLALLNYPVPPALLRPRLAPGLELDLYQGQAWVSLVAFDFLDTRVLGVPWPGFRTFPEINLRFYVRWGDHRGVMFVREFVPQPFVARMARRIYNEPYAATAMRSATRESADLITIEHRLEWAGSSHALTVTGSKPARRPASASSEHFFKEHQWGFGRTRGGRTLRYQVSHPEWDVYPVQSYDLQLDWAAVYGPEWEILHGAAPASTILAAGSPVRVMAGSAI